MNRLALVLIAILLLAIPAEASGVRADRYLSRDEVARMATHVLVAKATKLDHVYNAGPCRGSDVTYMVSFGIEALVTQVLKGDPALKGRRVWLHKRVPGVPCAWIRLDWLFIGDLGVAAVKPGTALLTYSFAETISPRDDGRIYIDVVGLDGLDQVQPVLKVLGDRSLPPLKPPSKPSLIKPGRASIPPMPHGQPAAPPKTRSPPTDTSASPKPERPGDEQDPDDSGGVGACSCNTAPSSKGGALATLFWLICGAVALRRRDVAKGPHSS